MTNFPWFLSVVRVWEGHTYNPGTFRGSAFFIAPEVLLTSKHVVQRCMSNVFVSGGAWTGIRKIRNIIVHDQRDVAILMVDSSAALNNTIRYPEPTSAALNRARGKAYLAGFVDARTDLIVREAELAGYYGLTDTLALASQIDEGMSGGPLVLEGRVYGIIQAERNGLAFIIPLTPIWDFIDRYCKTLDNRAKSRIFVQVLNPEIMRIYGLRPALTPALRSAIWCYFRYAFLVATDFVVMPASYIFEVEGINLLLEPLRPIISEGLLQFANPTTTLAAYADLKRDREYRDRSSYSRDFDLAKLSIHSLPIIPRVLRSTSHDIASSWMRDSDDQLSWLGSIMSRIYKETGERLDSIEYRFKSLPSLLDGRAFIAEYVRASVGFELHSHEDMQLAFFLSRQYMLSYMEEFEAYILNDTMIGRFDCGLSGFNSDGHPLVRSLRDIRLLFDALGIRNEFETAISWEQLVTLRSHPVVRRFADRMYFGGGVEDDDAPIGAAGMPYMGRGTDMIVDGLARIVPPTRRSTR